jgi:hypothetical protein
MTSDAEVYLDDLATPTIVDFEKAPASRQRAFLACVALFHAVDYLAKRPGSPNKRILRKQFREGSADFAIVDRVAHAFKHVKAGNSQSSDNKPLHVRAVFSRPPAFAGVMVAGLSYLGDLRGGVEIWNERGSDLLGVVKRASAFIRAKL